MPDSVVYSSGPDEWEVYIRPDNVCIGYIKQSGQMYSVQPIAGSPLLGIGAAPHRSFHDAMRAIGSKLMGSCKAAT
jgi:hypothetical protein